MSGPVARLAALRLAPDGRPRPGAPFGRGPAAARVLARVIDGAAWAGCRVPPHLAHALARGGGVAEWATRPGLRRTLAVNLGHAVGRPPDAPAVRRLVRRELVNEARRSADLLWALGRPREFLESTVVEGIHQAQELLEAGTGIILCGIHVGGWEVATAIPGAMLPAPTTVITADNWLAWAIEHMRGAAGLQVMYRSEPAIRAARLLRRGEVLLALGDDGAGAEFRGYEVRFLDARAVLPGGLPALARMARVPILGFQVLPLGPRRWRVTIDPPVAPPAPGEGAEGERRLLQQLADRWSEVIRENPAHWSARYPIAWVPG